PERSGLKASREQEILEPVVDVTEGADMPAKAIAAEGMRADTPPNRLRPLLVHRLIENLNRGLAPERSQDHAEDSDVHPAMRHGHGVHARGIGQPCAVAMKSGVGRKQKLRKVAIRVRFQEARPERLGREVALLA